MDILSLKSVFLVLLLLVTLVAGFPLYWSRISLKLNQYVSECDSFARGVFFCIGLVHLLPEAQEKFNQIEFLHEYHLHFLIPAISIFAFIILLWIEKSLPRLINRTGNPNFVPMVLVTALCLHSFIEGYALGVEESTSGVMLLFFAIIIHKGIESMALSFKLSTSSLSRRQTILNFLLFSLMTPLGIILGTVSIRFLNAIEDSLLSSIADAIAAGTFLYIGTIHEADGHGHEHEKPFAVWAFTLGVVLMIFLIEYSCNHFQVTH